MPAARKTVSDAQLAANRANAQKSTGPRTPEGKAVSRFNAMLHGICARATVLPGEDREDLVLLTADLTDELDPQTALEREAVERIVQLVWRRRRVAMAEREALQAAAAKESRNTNGNAAADPPSPETGQRRAAVMSAAFDKSGDDLLLRIANYDMKLGGAIDAATRQLHRLQDRRLKAERQAEKEEAKAERELNKPIAGWPTWLSRQALRAFRPNEPKSEVEEPSQAPEPQEVESIDDSERSDAAPVERVKTSPDEPRPVASQPVNRAAGRSHY